MSTRRDFLKTGGALIVADTITELALRIGVAADALGAELAAIAPGQTQNVPLGKSLPVYVLYWTAFVDADGTVEFRDDVYGRDRRLADALSAVTASEHLAAKEENRRS